MALHTVRNQSSVILWGLFTGSHSGYRPSNAGLIDEHALPIVTPREAIKAKDQAVELPTAPIYFGSVPEVLKESEGRESGKPSNGAAVLATAGSLPKVETPFAKQAGGGKTADAAKAGCQCVIC
jgi:hypothetical protein